MTPVRWHGVHSTVDGWPLGLVSADCLHQNQKQENAQRLFSFVFQEANQRIRLLMEHNHEEFNQLIIQVWTRLMMIFPDEYVQMAYDAVNDIDNLDHILLSFVNTGLKSPKNAGLTRPVSKVLRSVSIGYQT